MLQVPQQVVRAAHAFDASMPLVVGRGADARALSPVVGRRFVESIERVLDGLGDDVAPITNQRAGGVVRALRNGGALRAGGSGRTRIENEVRLGISLDGAKADVTYCAMHASRWLREPGRGAPILDTGQNLYGGVALVLRPSALERSTITGLDTQYIDARLLPPNQLPRAYAESFAALATARSSRAPVDLIEPLRRGAAPTEDAIRGALQDARLHGRRAGSAESAFWGLGLPEVQVHGSVRMSDVREIRLSGRPPAAISGAIEGDARRLGIPVVIEGRGDDLSNFDVWGEELVQLLEPRDTAEYVRVFGELRTSSGAGGWDDVAAMIGSTHVERFVS